VRPHSLFSGGTLQQGQPSHALCQLSPSWSSQIQPQPPLQAALVCAGGSASFCIYCQLSLGHCLGEHLGLQGQLVGSQFVTLALLFTARGHNPQPQLPVHIPPCHSAFPRPSAHLPAHFLGGNEYFSGTCCLPPSQLLRKQPPTLLLSQPQAPALLTASAHTTACSASPQVTTIPQLAFPQVSSQHTLLCPTWHPPSSPDAPQNW